MMTGSFTEMAQQVASKAFDKQLNVDETERLVSAIGGGAVLLTTANLRSLRGLLATVVGASLVYRGVTGHCPFYSFLGLKTCGQESRGKDCGSQSNSGSRERVGFGA
ncbi:MAG TPA: DUF2892 domain-containing protein [Planctomycetaceae bacterium]|jgi:uncharacterized membrane protein|nr:DUF2892 domain-containing protein [Planctomycetaceae bacterium]